MNFFFSPYISKNALLVFFVGLFIVASTVAYRYLHPGQAFIVPIEFHYGTVLSKEFETAFSDNYEINLTLNISCGLMTNDCPKEIPKFNWTVSDSQSVIAENKSSFARPSSWSKGTTGFSLGSFKAVAGKKYKLEVLSSKAVEAGVLPESTLEVSLDHSVFKDMFVILGLIQLFGLLLFIVSFLYLIGFFVFKYYFQKIKK